jgi:hypothetical protein
MKKKLCGPETKKMNERCSRTLYVMLFACCLVFARPPHAGAAMIYSGAQNLSIPDEATLAVDLDGDGVSDFDFVNVFSHNMLLNTDNYKNYIDLFQHPQNAVFGGGTAKNFDPGISFPSPDDAGWQSWNQDTGNATINTGYYNVGAGNFHDTGKFNNTTGFIAVRFQIHGNTHYGWLQYKGTVLTPSTTKLSDTIVDWAYNDKPFTTGFVMGERGCIDNDGDGYGEGPGCIGPDLDDNDPTVTDNTTCHVVLTPDKLRKAFSFISPVKMIVIRSSGNTEFSAKPVINWGTNAIKTSFQLRLNNKTILAVVRVLGLSLEVGSVYQVKVDDCTGRIEVAPLVSPIEVTLPQESIK